MNAALSPDAEVEAIRALGIVLGALVTVFGSITLALLARTRTHAKRASLSAASADEQVSNEHSTNLREEQDVRHAELMGLVREVRTEQRASDRRNAKRFSRLERRVNVVEDTLPHPNRRR